MASTLVYQELEPDIAVRSHVARYWAFEVSAQHPGPVQHSAPPDGCISLVYGRTAHGRWLALVGPRVDALQVTLVPGACYWGVRFWPGAGGSALRCSAAALRGQLCPAPDSLRTPAGPLAAQLAACETFAAATHLLDEALPHILVAAPPLDLQVMQSVFALLHHRGRSRIHDLAAAAALSERQFQRRFRAAVGLTPKELARIARVRAAAIQLLDDASPQWPAVAADAGYFDQSHLIRDFARILGRTPTALRDWMATIEHRNVG